MEKTSEFDLSKLNKILVAIIFLGIVAFFVLYTVWQNQLYKRDAKRKADLARAQQELEDYFAKNGSYPLSIDLPLDPERLLSYYYKKEKDKEDYRLYARLENAKDPDVVWGLAVECGAARCNYVVSKP